MVSLGVLLGEESVGNISREPKNEGWEELKIASWNIKITLSSLVMIFWLSLRRIMPMKWMAILGHGYGLRECESKLLLIRQ